ncbi:MAG: hypothetical protein JWP04_622 [Belnapia sp.]|nr:hypothetical protein [Belnapia sp.]
MPIQSFARQAGGEQGAVQDAADLLGTGPGPGGFSAAGGVPEMPGHLLAAASGQLFRGSGKLVRGSGARVPPGGEGAYGSTIPQRPIGRTEGVQPEAHAAAATLGRHRTGQQQQNQHGNHGRQPQAISASRI